MRVALLYPHLFHHPAPALPIGLAWLGAALRARGHHVRLLDLSFVWNRSRAIPRFLTEVEPDVIGLGVPYLDNDCAFHSLSFLPTVRWVADTVRAASPAPIVAGGWGVTRAPDDVLRYLGLRFGFVGGDVSRASEWLEAVAAGRSDREVPGAARWESAAYRATAPLPSATPTAGHPATAAHDLLPLARHEAHGGAAVIPVDIAIDAATIRRDPAEIDHELGALLATSDARRVLFAGWCVGLGGAADDALLERLAMRGPALAWEMCADPLTVTRERIATARRAGMCALRLQVGDEAELDGLRRALALPAQSLPVIVDVRLGGPHETVASLSRKLVELKTLPKQRTCMVLRPGVRLWAPPSDEVRELRGGAAGDSFVWPRFGLATAVEASLRDRLRSVTADRPGASLDSDAYAPWQRFAHGSCRRSGVWPAWRLDSHVADLGKRLRSARIERVPFRNQPR